MQVAVIVGGAPSYQADLNRTLQLCSVAPAAIFAVNDQICTLVNANHAATLHPSKLPAWLEKRNHAGLPPVENVWSFDKFDAYPGVTRISPLPHWQGSSGLYAVKIALELGHRKIILCGVPLDPAAGHIDGRKKWNANAFRRGWILNLHKIQPFVRGWGGWTRKLLGEPTRQWLEI